MKDDLKSNTHYIRMRYGENVRKTFMKVKKLFIKGELENKDDELVTLRRQISWKEYKSYEQMKVERMNLITRERASFIWKGQNFLVDCMSIGDYNFAILIISSEVMNETVEHPEVILNSTICKITDVDEWQMYNIAEEGWQPPMEHRENVMKK